MKVIVCIALLAVSQVKNKQENNRTIIENDKAFVKEQSD